MSFASRRRTVGFASLAAGVALATVGLFAPPAGADTVYDETEWDAHLDDSHHGVVGSEFENQQDDCPRGEGQEDGTVWHFVLVPGTDSFEELRVTFEDAGEIVLDEGDFGPPTDKHAYVWTPTDDTLLDGVADVVEPGEADRFVLSHVCGGDDTTTTSQATTTSEATTTSQATTSSVLDTVVTTGAPTTTDETVAGEVVTREPTLPRTGSTTLPLLQLGVGLILTGLGVLRYGRTAAAKA